MVNTFVTQGIEIVTLAIKEDNSKNYEEALRLYKKALEHFMIGIKYEMNPEAKAIITKRVEGYMVRAEQLNAFIREQSAPKPAAAGSNPELERGD